MSSAWSHDKLSNTYLENIFKTETFYTPLFSIQWNLSNRDTNGAEESVVVSEVSSLMHARVVLGVGKGVLFREMSSVHECPHRERGSTVVYIQYECNNIRTKQRPLL